MSIKGVIFDVDGVLLDTMPVWTDSGARYLASLGIEAESHLGDKLFCMTVEMGAEYLKEHYSLPYTIAEIKAGINGCVEQYYFTEAGFKPGARELLEKLKAAGVPVTIATSTDKYCILAAFDRLGYTDYFDANLTCGEVGASKSEPKIFYEAAASWGRSRRKHGSLRTGCIPSKPLRRRDLRPSASTILSAKRIRRRSGRWRISTWKA